MTKKEFLDILADALSGNIPMSEVNENIKYYRDYIENGESSEEEALKKLGDPHLIARTIIDSFKASKGSMADYYTKQARDEYSKISSGNSYDSYNNENSYENVSGHKRGFHMNSQYYMNYNCCPMRFCCIRLLPAWYNNLPLNLLMP